MFQKGVAANPNGRAPLGREKRMFELLDTVGIPLAIKHNIEILNGTHPSIKKIKDGPAKLRLQTDSSKILLSKAPNRIEGTGEGGEITLKFMQFGEALTISGSAITAPEIPGTGKGEDT